MVPLSAGERNEERLESQLGAWLLADCGLQNSACVLVLEVEIVGQDLASGGPCREQVQHALDAQSEASDARTSSTSVRTIASGR